MRLEQEKLWWLNGCKTAGHTRSTGQQACTLRYCICNRMIGIEGIFLGMRYDNVRCHLTNELGHTCQRQCIDGERIVTQVKTLETCPQRFCCLGCFGVTDMFYLLHGLPRLFP